MHRENHRNPSPDSTSAHHQRHLTQRELADRWNKSEATIERYRSDGVGPRFLKIGGAVRYRLEDIEAFEQECLYDSPHSRCASNRTSLASEALQRATA